MTIKHAATEAVIGGAEWNADHVIEDAAALRTALGLADVATSGAYGDLDDLPTLGTAAAEDASAFEPADPSILKSAAIGDSVAAQTHDHDGVYAPIDAEIASFRATGVVTGRVPTADGSDGVVWAEQTGGSGEPILVVRADGTEESLPGSSLNNVTLNGYSETGAVLSISAGEVTIPLDGRIYAVTLDEAVALITSDAPTAPICGSAMLYLQQSDPAETVTLPATWYWPDGEAEAFDEAGALYRLTLYTDPFGNIHADATRQAVPA